MVAQENEKLNKLTLWDFHRLPPIVQITVILSFTAIGIIALIFGKTDIALIVVVALSPTPITMILGSFYDLAKWVKIITNPEVASTIPIDKKEDKK